MTHQDGQGAWDADIYVSMVTIPTKTQKKHRVHGHELPLHPHDRKVRWHRKLEAGEGCEGGGGKEEGGLAERVEGGGRLAQGDESASLTEMRREDAMPV